MKLRNKNTGEIGDINLKVYGDDAEYVYDKIETLYKEWEDLTPKEPLIKDPEIRDIVLAWALSFSETRNKEVKCIQCCGATELVATSNCLARITLPTIPDLLHLNDYTIAELCGEGQ